MVLHHHWTDTDRQPTNRTKTWISKLQFHPQVGDKKTSFGCNVTEEETKGKLHDEEAQYKPCMPNNYGLPSDPLPNGSQEQEKQTAD